MMLHNLILLIIPSILQDPDRTRTRTKSRTREKPGLAILGLTFEKSRTYLHKTRTRLIKKTEFKT